MSVAALLLSLQERQIPAGVPTSIPAGIPTTIPAGIAATIPGTAATAVPTARATTVPNTSPNTSASDILNGATNLATWDGCMAKAYCKWPVIIGMIIGAIIVFSILWCLVRCVCLGKDFACCCFRCLSCCCGPKRTPEGFKYNNVGSTPPTRAGQYESHGNMQYGKDPFAQTATFEGTVHADSLPSMPSWETAASRKVEVVEKVPESVEMEPIREAKSPSLRGPTPTPRPTGLSRTQSGFSDTSQSPRMGLSRTGSGMDGIPSPMRSESGHNGFSPMNPQRTNSGHNGMPSPLEPTLPNMYGSSNRSQRSAASPVYGNDQSRSGTPRLSTSPLYGNDQSRSGGSRSATSPMYGHDQSRSGTPRAAASPIYGNDQYSSRGPASGRNTPQTPFTPGGYDGRSTPRSPYGPPTNSSYSTANNAGYGPPTNSSYSTAHNGFDVSDYMDSGSQYSSDRGDRYGGDNAYGPSKGTSYSSHGGSSLPYMQPASLRPGPQQQQGSYI